ncbi:hypothetical protein EVAR_25141_1 [Eumeta japonica]|uniref:Uncharacterized protein n=1 Tax=Eumeta variegata TaxID=151549 RepID=A0A4C1XLK1_EUMVA|nr:hypothetical protein EVAR_25141_1 [Eumeta japonica]
MLKNEIKHIQSTLLKQYIVYTEFESSRSAVKHIDITCSSVGRQVVVPTGHSGYKIVKGRQSGNRFADTSSIEGFFFLHPIRVILNPDPLEPPFRRPAHAKPPRTLVHESAVPSVRSRDIGSVAVAPGDR